ncbi:MAG: phytoene desaturase [Myxococcales bacterium]|nr:phytoene desaturase [Myxococcales bacterium]
MPSVESSRALVIGGGVGGLTAAIELAARGLSVTVLERAQSLGGKMRVVELAGRSLDVGPTVLTMRWVFDAVFSQVGRRFEDYVKLSPAEVLARHTWADGARLDLFHDVGRSAEAIGAFAGAQEAKGYRAFVAHTKTIFDNVEGPFLRAERPTLGSVLRQQGLKGLASLTRIDATRTLWRSLGDFFRDPRLLQLFGRYATYAGSSPFLCPATLAVIAHVEREGVWYPVDGMISVAQGLERLGAELGVQYRLGCEVREVLVEQGRAAGVVLASGEVLRAEVVVANAAVEALAAGRLGAGVKHAVEVDPRAGRSLSAVTYAMVARASGFPLVRHNVFFSRDYHREFNEIFEQGRLPSEATVYVCAQDRDDRGGVRAGEAGERLFMIVNAPARGGLRALTRTEIDACETQTQGFLARLGLNIAWAEAPRVTTTPDDFEAMFPATGGALYGPPSHGWTSPMLRAGSRSKVKGLYLVGGSTHPGAGVPMVAQSGRLAATAVAEDLASTARSFRAATPGGMLTR